MSKFASPFYPPRAPWYRPRWNIGAAVKRRLHLDRLRLPATISLHGLIFGLLVPGLAFGVRGSRLWGRLALAASGLLTAVFFAWLGHPAGNVAFGLLLSIHSTGIVYLCEPWLFGARMVTRMFFSLAILMLLGGLLYMPLRQLLQEHCLLPMNVRGQVVVVRAYASTASVKRGDWIAYSINDVGGHGVYVQAGYGLGPVLAVAGDRVQFGQTTFAVNGLWRARRANMPTSGECIVPEFGWFVWPEVDISGHGNISAAALAEQLMKMAMITKEQFIGKPFKWWFWHRQFQS